MTPLFFSVGNNKPVKVIPNVQAQVDGHPVLTYTYNVYRDGELDEEEEKLQESELLLETKTDHNYLGFITFEEPGRLFTYTSGEHDELTAAEVEEIIENITHYRDHPGLWNVEGIE